MKASASCAVQALRPRGCGLWDRGPTHHARVVGRETSRVYSRPPRNHL